MMSGTHGKRSLQARGIDPGVTLPDGIGPHEGREFTLMRAGSKHVALFFELEPDGLDEILEDGFELLKFPQFVHKDTVYFTWIVFRPSYGEAALRLKHLVTAPSKSLDPVKEHEIGAILGYQRKDVDSFINHVQSSNHHK